VSSPGLKDLSPGQEVSLTCLLARKQIATTRAGKPFGALTLMDAGGQVEAKLWDRAEELLAPLREGQAVEVSGRVELYNGQLQMVLSHIAPAAAEPWRFLPRSPHKPAVLWQRLTELMLGVRHRGLRRLLEAFFEEAEFHAAFERAPAAKSAHHAYLHGLLEHTVSVGELARRVAEHYPELDRDLMVAGALLHDVGKVEELSLGPPIDYTDAGRLEGHLVLGVRLLEARLAGLRGFPSELAGHLRHLILSHHGAYEFGSPRRPKTAEAMALHLIDDLDAKLAMVRQAVAEGGGEGHWSPYHRLLERFLYTGPSPTAAAAGGAASAGEDKPRPAEAPALPSLFDRD
jgi:3'-5' exoribonuclease